MKALGLGILTEISKKIGLEGPLESVDEKQIISFRTLSLTK